ncbi:MAG: polysaccharide biosynthesis C-terminal domain-containing protein, partial [Erysipelotrichaceae bacterium]|nr:polysaccharide biosynthesis C-terminal domain-containing protein [Erysipelotrichaceae bacterium]
YSVATYFVMFIMLGVANYGNRSVARVKNDRKKLTKTFWTIYYFQFLRGLLVVFVYLLYVFFFAQKYIWIALINGIYVLSAMIDISWMFFGLELFKITVTRNVVIRLANVLCIFAFVKQQNDLWIYSLIVVMSSFLSTGYLWFYLKNYVDWYKPTIKEIIPHIKPELILFIPVIAISLYKVMDRIMLGSMSTDTQLGFYTQAESVINIPMGLITALGTVMLPRISHMLANGEDEKTKEYIENSMFVVTMMNCAMAFGLAAIAPVFTPVFFGEKFAECSNIIIGLSITIIFISWANIVRTQYLIPRGRDKSFLISVVTGAFVNLVLNTLLIPKLAAMGAVIGTVCAEASVCFIQIFMVRKELPILLYVRKNLGFILIGLIMFISVRVVGTFDITPFLKLLAEIGAGAVVYIGLTLLFLYFTNRFNLVLRMIKNK